MAWFRRSAPPCRIFLHRSDGRELRRELPPDALDLMIRRILQQGDAATAKSWERSGQFHSSAVLAAWPAGLPQPERALLRGGGGEASGPWLEAAFDAGAPLQEIAEDLERVLLALDPLERVHAEPVAAEPPATREPPAPVEPPRASIRPPPPAAPRIVRRSTLPARHTADPLQPEEGLFTGLADGLLDPGIEVRPADLPGLDRGDRLQSPRRGSCVILQSAAGPGLMLLRDERGREIAVSHAELTTEFSFDDPVDEPELA